VLHNLTGQEPSRRIEGSTVASRHSSRSHLSVALTAYRSSRSEQAIDGQTDDVIEAQIGGSVRVASPVRSVECAPEGGDGGMGAYFADPSGHSLEIITWPYGSGSATGG
jgi:hypothetical protein